MSLREEQCKKVCRILDNVLANRPTERDSLIVATRNAFSALSEPHKGHWEPVGVAEAVGGESAMWGSAIAYHRCSECGEQALEEDGEEKLSDFCPHCGAKMEVTE